MHKSNLSRTFAPSQKPDVYSLLYMSHIDMDSRSRENPYNLGAFGDLPPIGQNAARTEQVFRDLLPIRRDIITEQALIYKGEKVVVLGNRTSQLEDIDYHKILKYNNLRVLDLGNVQIQWSADTFDLGRIAMLVHLKYLAVRVCTTKIPFEVGKLRNLETFLVSGAIGEILLPEAIWKLVRLREVIMDDCFFSLQYYTSQFFELSSQPYSLKSISNLYMGHENIEKFMRRLTGVQKLGCLFPSSLVFYYEPSNLHKVLECLCELQSLKMIFYGRAPYFFRFSFPSNLKKLKISNARVPWEQISVIGQLPNLEVLKLLNRAFEGRQWDMREGEFQKLKFLKLDSLDIVEWNACSEHLPCLEQLLVLSCQQLEQIPSSFGEIVTLQLIEMKWCSASAMDSVKQILQDQRDLSNDQLNVIVVGQQRDLA